MSKVVFITQNNPETRQKLEEAGYSLCICSTFVDTVWLEYYPDGQFPKDIHGEGYVDEGDPLEGFPP